MAPKRKREPPADLFQGFKIVFLCKEHLTILTQRVQQYGGTVQPAPTPETTHLVFNKAHDMAAAVRELEALPLPLDHTVSLQGHAIKLYKGVQYVAREFFSRSIGLGELQQEEDHRPDFYVTAKLMQVEAASKEAAAAGQAGVEQHDEQPSTSQVDLMRADTVPLTSEELHEAAQSILPTTEAEAAADEATDDGLPCVVVRRGSDWVAVQGRKPRFTGGHTCIPWGSFGVFDEPYDEATARATVEKVRAFWYKTGAGDSLQHEGSPLIPAKDDAGDGVWSAGAKSTNGVCSHSACAKRPFCLVARLAEAKNMYHEKQVFERKAIDRACGQLSHHPSPLDRPDDVDAVSSLGAKTALKVQEILASGGLQRVAAAAARAATDPHTQAVTLFQEVWGVGEAGAEQWWKAGCRSLEEVKAKFGDALSEQQKVGLKYFDDLNVRIPAAEVAAAERHIRRRTFEAVESLGATDPERTYVYATGSFRRGAPDCSDIDILIALPPSLSGTDAGGVLCSLLTALRQEGFLLDEMNPMQPHKSSHANTASWMGVCRPDGAPCVRRIDVKVYDAPYAPYAVNYFANSRDFCRATRHWANRATGELARKVHPSAVGFKLSDKVLVPIANLAKRGGGEGRGGRDGVAEQALLSPAVECSNETEIFEALGLDYVPVTMRFFGNFY